MQHLVNNLELFIAMALLMTVPIALAVLSTLGTLVYTTHMRPSELISIMQRDIFVLTGASCMVAGFGAIYAFIAGHLIILYLIGQ